MISVILALVDWESCTIVDFDMRDLRNGEEKRVEEDRGGRRHLEARLPFLSNSNYSRVIVITIVITIVRVITLTYAF
jgi:hypothetical protein